MKNAGHIAGKNVLIFGDRVDRLLGGRLRHRVRRRQRRSSARAASSRRPTSCSSVGQAPFAFFSEIPGAAGYLFEVVFAGVSLAIVWGAMAERAKLWVYFVFGVCLHADLLGRRRTGSGARAAGCSRHGMQDFAGSTVVHYQGALAGLAGALLLGPRIGKFGHDGRANPIPGHNMPYAVLGDDHPLVRLVRLQPGLDARGRRPAASRLLRATSR